MSRSKAPALASVRRQLRVANRFYDGPGHVGLARSGQLRPHHGEIAEHEAYAGFEELPGDNRPCDYIGIARRLCAAWRDKAEIHGW